MDILKMSNFEKLEESFGKKFTLLGHRVKYQKNNSKVVSIIFQKKLFGEYLGDFYIDLFYMNVNIKIEKNKEFFNCEICNYKTSKITDYNKHLLTLKHQNRDKKATLSINCRNKISPNFNCEKCHYYTSKQTDYNKHLLTLKHKINNENNETVKKSPINICDGCSKQFNSYNSLWKHKNKYNCKKVDDNTIKEPSNTITSEMFMEFFKQSKELQNVLIEQNKELQNKLITMAQTPSIVNNNNTLNNNNQQFNLQFFLNETCKDAINITDFVNSLELKVEDFEATGKLGYVEGISRIIINEMNDMEVEKRPMHCTDFKRETLYIKDDNVWIKENQDKNKFKKVVKKVAQLNLNQFTKWQAKYPDCVKVNTKENDEFIKLSLAALGSRDDEEEEKFMDKILKNVLKEVVVTKKS
jgi:hypothetical protein